MLDWFKNLPTQFKIALLGGVLIFFFLLILITFPLFNKGKPLPGTPSIPIFNPSNQETSVLPTPSLATQPTIRSVMSLPNPNQPPKDVKQLQGTSVTFPSLYNGYIYYLSDAGTRFYKVSLDGKDKQPVSDPLHATVKQVVWSPDKSAVIIKILNDKFPLKRINSPFYSDSDPDLNLTNWYYNFNTKEIDKLSSLIGPATFSADATSLFYFKTDPSTGKINILYQSSLQGSNETSISQISQPNQDNLFFIPQNQVISYAEPEGYGRNYVYLTNIDNKNTTSLNSDGLTFNAVISPENNKLISQTVDKTSLPYKFYLSLIDISSKRQTNTGILANINLTAWAQDGSIFYALDSDKKLWIVDPNTLQKTFIPFPDNYKDMKVDLNSLMVGPDKKSVYFTSQNILYNFSF